MGEVCFVTFDAESGRPSASVSGRPVDVADFLAVWAQNSTSGLSLAQLLGVEFVPEPEGDDEE